MDDTFTDKQLNVGKVLVLGSGHNLKLAEIKRLTRATKVRKLKWTGNYDDIDTFVLSTVMKALDAMKGNDFIGADVYMVEGATAVTTMLTLKVDKFCTSVDFDATRIKKLHNACLTKMSIDRAKRQMNEAISSHNDLSVMLTKQKIKNAVTNKTKALDKLINGYADAELNEAMEKINDIMGNSW